MVAVKELDEIPNTKISMNSNLEPNEQQGVELIFLSNIYVCSETSMDMQEAEAA